MPECIFQLYKKILQVESWMTLQINDIGNEGLKSSIHLYITSELPIKTIYIIVKII